MSGFAGHIDSWLATARQEKIASLKGVNGYNPSHNTRETCTGFNLNEWNPNNQMPLLPLQTYFAILRGGSFTRDYIHLFSLRWRSFKIGQHDYWLAIARQEKIAILMKINGYNP